MKDFDKNPWHKTHKKPPVVYQKIENFYNLLIVQICTWSVTYDPPQQCSEIERETDEMKQKQIL